MHHVSLFETRCCESRHGRDLRGGEPYSQQIILGRQPVEVPADDWQVLLVRPEARLGMLISPHRDGSRLLRNSPIKGANPIHGKADRLRKLEHGKRPCRPS